jgi:hypothetical protein
MTRSQIPVRGDRSKPWMPGIKNFPFLGPVGRYVADLYITKRARTWGWARTRP